MPFAGSDNFLDVLLSKEFKDPSESVISMHGSLVTESFFNQHGFTNPILIPHKDGLQIRVPENNFSIPDIAQYVGLDFKLDVIDVRTQDEVTMTMKEFAEYYYSPDRSRLLNVLSMEFSKTGMSNVVVPPRVVSNLSLVETCWPPTEDSEWEEEEGHSRRPSVQKYCLISMGNSYTDFHIDFGGSSVWYHVLWGEKIFYLIPPTRDNLRAYRYWFQLPHSRSVFFPDFLHEYLNKTVENAGENLKTCSNAKKKKKRDHFKPDYDLMYSCPVRHSYNNVYKMTISSGNTVLLPSGWIHAVYTPVDSIVFGGNFMHAISIPLQLTIYRMEKKLKTDKKFMFPYFEKLHWFVAERILSICKNYLLRGEKPPSHYLEGGKCLVKALNKWIQKRKAMPNAIERSYYLPDPGSMELTCSELLKQLNKVTSDLSKCKSFGASSSLSVSPVKGKSMPKRKGDSTLHNQRKASRKLTVKHIARKSVKRKPNPANVCEASECKIKKLSSNDLPSNFQINQSNVLYNNESSSSLYTTLTNPSLSSHSTPGMAVISQDNHQSGPFIQNHCPLYVSSSSSISSLNQDMSQTAPQCLMNVQCAPKSTSFAPYSSMKQLYTSPPLSSSSKTSTPYSNPYDFDVQDYPDGDESLKSLRKKKKKKKKKKEKVIYTIVRDTLSDASLTTTAPYVHLETKPPVICDSNNMTNSTEPSSSYAL